ncbi:MAG TPA: hypothetical protein VLA24_17675 [Pseudomonadales bacterium]|nr:hypothetical protein [Pseudomonadales bacterium]
MADNLLVAFNQSDASELLSLIGEKALRGGAIANADRMQADCLIGVAKTTITARAGAVLGTGEVYVKYIDNANTLQDLYEVDVVNMGSAIAIGAYVKIFRVGSNLSVVEVC